MARCKSEFVQQPAAQMAALCIGASILPQVVELLSELRDHFLQIFHRGDLISDLCGQFARDPIARHTDRLIDVLKRVLDDRPAVRLTKQQTYAPSVRRRTHQVVDSGEVKAELARPLRFKPAGFEFNHKVAVQAHVVEKQVNIEGLSIDLDWHLAADEGETPSELQEEVAEMNQKSTFDLPFVSSLSDREEIEVVRIFEDLLGEIGVGRRQGSLEVRERLPFPLLKSALDLKHQDVSAPAMLQCCAEIPRAVFRILQTIQEHHVVTPRQ